MVQFGMRFQEREQRLEMQCVYVRVEEGGRYADVRVRPEHAHAQLQVGCVLVVHVVRVHQEQGLVDMQRVLGAVPLGPNALVRAQWAAIVGHEQVRGPIALAFLASAFACAALVQEARHGRHIRHGAQVRHQEVGERHVHGHEIHRHDERVLRQLPRRC